MPGAVNRANSLWSEGGFLFGSLMGLKNDGEGLAVVFGKDRPLGGGDRPMKKVPSFTAVATPGGKHNPVHADSSQSWHNPHGDPATIRVPVELNSNIFRRQQGEPTRDNAGKSWPENCPFAAPGPLRP